MKVYIFERPFVHLYLANKKRIMFCLLENMKSLELPKKEEVKTVEESNEEYYPEE
jgi:hypothetical protein